MNFINRFLTIAKPFSLELLALAIAHSQTLRAFVARHPKHVTAALAVVLLGGGGGAFAVAIITSSISFSYLVVSIFLTHCLIKSCLLIPVSQLC
jgi:hypothetical protein